MASSREELSGQINFIYQALQSTVANIQSQGKQQLQQQLNSVLSRLQQPDNNVRSAAESELAVWSDTRPAVLLMGLAMLNAQQALPAQQRSFAAVILRRIASKTYAIKSSKSASNTTELFAALSQDTDPTIRNAVSGVCQALLMALKTEGDRNVSHKTSDTVAEIARQYTEAGIAWPELQAALLELSSIAKRETAFRILAACPDIIRGQHAEIVKREFVTGLVDSDVEVRIGAIEAFGAFFRPQDKRTKSEYGSVVPLVVQTLDSLKTGSADELSRALVAIIDMAETGPKFFKPIFKTLIDLSISIIAEENLDSICRQNALELMATFADYAPSMCKTKSEGYVENMVTQCLRLMAELGDDDEVADWVESDDLDSEENDLNHVAGEQCMDRLANKLGAPVYHFTFQFIARMANPTWRHLHAALMAISAISEGCHEQMIGKLAAVLGLVIPALTNAHPRVRWAGCNALGQMSTDFAPNMQQGHGNLILPALLHCLKSPEARVKSHAAAALVNFCEEADKTVLQPYLHDLLEALIKLLEDPKLYVQEQALSTIATVADSAEREFKPYCPFLIPKLIGILEAPEQAEKRLLRAKAMECATLIALAVGREELGADAMRLVATLKLIQMQPRDADDPQSQYLMHCWGRMCQVLGQEFVPYLSLALTPLLEMAQSKAEVQLVDYEAHAEQLEEEGGWEFISLRGKTLGIKTSAMEDKHMAMELLIVYAQVLGGVLAPHATEIMTEIAIPGLKFFCHDPVRVVAAKMVPQLLNCCKLAAAEKLEGLWSKTVTQLLDVLNDEPAIEILAEMFQCFYESIESIGQRCLTADQMRLFIDRAETRLSDYDQRWHARQEERATLTADELDDESEDTLFAIEDDQTLLSDMNKAFHSIFKYHGTEFLPHWKRLLQVYQKFLNSEDPTRRQWGLCIMDDVLEFCGDESAAYMEQIGRALISGCQDTSSAIRQAAAYGIGVAAHKGGNNWTQFAGEAIKYLFQAVQLPNPRDEENVYATENVCAAVAKILRYNSSAVEQPEQVAAQWVETLPVTNDEEAAPYAYEYLCVLIENGFPAVTSQPGKVFELVAQALAANLLEGKSRELVVEKTRYLMTATSTDATPFLDKFSPEDQNVIRASFA